MGIGDNRTDQLIEQCLNTTNHLPSPVSNHQILPGVCSPWTSNACCNLEIASKANNRFNHLAFDMNHCGSNAISHKCHMEFARELCYYSCDPYIKPWILKPEQNFQQERLMRVPLCYSECQRWWNACSDSRTCVRNWRKHFDLYSNYGTNVTINTCPSGSLCKPFNQIFSDAVDFCETVWDDSWLVVPDSAQCIRLYFHPNTTNPNKLVAENFKSFQQHLQQPREVHNETKENIIILILAILVLTFSIYLLVRCIKSTCF